MASVSNTRRLINKYYLLQVVFSFFITIALLGASFWLFFSVLGVEVPQYISTNVLFWMLVATTLLFSFSAVLKERRILLSSKDTERKVKEVICSFIVANSYKDGELQKYILGKMKSDRGFLIGDLQEIIMGEESVEHGN